MINTLCFFEIPGDDLDALIKFYGEMFQWKFEALPGKFRYYTIDMGSETIRGGITARQEPSHTPVNYVAVESVEAATKKALGLGAKLVVAKGAVPGAGWYSVLLDPQGNRLGLWEQDESAA